MRTLLARVLLASAATAVAALTAAAPAIAHHTLDGQLQGVHADYFDAGSSTTNWQLDTGSQTLDVLPTTLPALSPEHDGVALSDEDPGAGVAGPVKAASAEAAPALGGRKLAVIAFKFASDPVTPPWTTATIRSAIFTGSASTSAFFREETYNQLWLTGKAGNLDGDVYGWYTLPVAPASCDYTTWATLAKTAAVAGGFSAAGYQHVMYVFPRQSVCGWAGLAYLPGTESWINGDLSVRVTGHELGHNLGLHHAGSWACTGASNQLVSISSSCTLNEYNDPWDVMGAYGSRHNHAWNLQRLGVLQASNVQTVSATGTYTMTAAPVSATTAPTTLRVPRTSNPDGSVQDWYYLEVRKPGGVFDNFSLSDWAVRGVSIRVDDNPDQLTRSRLIDTHPGGSIDDAPLRPGETFSDGHVAITAVSAGSGSATVAVNMSAAPLDQQAPSAPTGLSHVLLANGLRLTWNGSGDNVGVRSYPVYRDGVEIGTASSNSFDDTTVTAGRHAYTVYAQDGAGNRSAASAPHIVTVRSAKSAALKKRPTDRTGPRMRLAHRRLRHHRMRLTGKARDRSGIRRLELRIDGRRVRARKATRLSYRWHERNGRHRIVLIAWDKRGNRSTYQLNVRGRA